MIPQSIAEIKTWGVEIRTEEDADLAIRIKGVGKGTITQLKEIVTHGSSLKAAEAEVGKTDRERTMEELSSLEGVGGKTAERLADNNIAGLKGLREAIRSSSVVLKECKVPDAGLRHAAWAEETTIPATRKEAELVRDAVAGVAKDVSSRTRVCRAAMRAHQPDMWDAFGVCPSGRQVTRALSIPVPQFGFSGVELTGAYARGEKTTTRVELMLVADAWRFEHRVDKLAAKTKTAARAYSKGGTPDDGTPDLEGLISELTK